MILSRIEGERFSEVLRNWVGRTVVVLGGGPSLTKEQVEVVRAEHWAGRVRCIAVNDSYLLAPWADVHYAADSHWHSWHTTGIAKSALGLSAEEVRAAWARFMGQKCTIQNSGANVKDDAVHMLRNASFPGYGPEGDFSTDPRYLATGRNSGFQAINLASLAGATLAILLGFDCSDSPAKTHWHGGHPRETPYNAWSQFRRHFTAAQNAIAASGLRVVNCSPKTAITAFDCMSLEKALALPPEDRKVRQPPVSNITKRKVAKPLKPEIRVRGGMGLGDSIYIRPVAEHLARKGERVVVLSNHPDVFIGSGVEQVKGFQRIRTEVVAHYVGGKKNQKTTQWQDVCAAAGVGEISQRFSWKIRNQNLVDLMRSKAAGRPIIIVHGGRAPMARTDGFGMELMPKREVFDSVLEELDGEVLLVQIGAADEVYPLRCRFNLNKTTTVSDLLDLGTICHGVVAQCSFAVPLAESMGKPLLALWGAGYVSAKEEFVRQLNPTKVLSQSTDHYVMDDRPLDEVRECARAFLGLIKGEME